MTPFGSSEDEQSEAERREIARRYRESRTRRLRELAAAAIGGETEVLAAGEFSTVPTASLAAIPIVGPFILLGARRRSKRSGLPPDLLLALDRETLYALGRSSGELPGRRPTAKLAASWPRADVAVGSVRKVFMTTEVKLRIAGAGDPLVLYAASLATNPQSAEVVRLLGGDAPEPLDLGEPAPGPGRAT